MSPRRIFLRRLAAAFFFSFLPTATATAQDECANALPVGNGTNGPYSIVAATPSPQPWHCGGLPNDLWFVYTATCCGNLTVDNCAPTFSMVTAIEVSDGSGGCGNLRMLDCQSSNCSYHATVTVPVVPGQVLYIRVGCDQFSYTSGNFNLHVACVPAVPANDECTGAIPLAQGQNGPFRSFCATASPQPWPCATAAGDIWFTYVATASGPHTFRSCGSTYNTAMQLLDGSAGCGNLVSIGCNDDFCGYQSSVTATLASGTTYYVRLGNVGGSEGLARIEVRPGNGMGTIVQGTPGCGAATIAMGGAPRPGNTALSIRLNNTTGPSVIGLGFGPFPTASVCGCIVGHGWQSVTFGTAMNVNVPNSPSVVGMQVGAQGADFGGSAGCASATFSLTPTWQYIIG